MKAKPPAKAPQRRNAEATRAKILTSAREAFTRLGYDGAGVREIAKGAGVTAMLINRYFGSKQELFAAVAVETMAKPVLLTPEFLASKDRAKLMAAGLVAISRTGATPLDGFLIIMRSAASAEAARIGSAQIEAHYQKTLAAALKGPDAAERAAMVLSVVAGFQLMRQGLALPALANADDAALTRVLENVLSALL